MPKKFIFEPTAEETAENKVEGIVQDIRDKNPTDNIEKEVSAFDRPIADLSSDNQPYKVSFKEYDVAFSDIYTQLNDGSSQAMVPNFIKGTDNHERAAQNQTTGEKWKNGALKALGNVGTTVLGGTVGAVNGIGEWISQGSFDAIYNNDFNNQMMDFNERLGYELPNYYSKQEQDLNFFQSATTANFWADKVLHGLSFTLGTIVSEGLWATATGGASLAGTAARGAARMGFGGFKTAAQVAKANTSFAKWGKQAIRSGQFNPSTVKNIGKAVETGNLLRFTYTSAGYEAGVEALSFTREAEENFRRQYEEGFGRQPNSEEWAKFKDELTPTANAVFGINVGLVGASNLAVFGRMYGLSNPFKGAQTAANRSLFGIGEKAATREGKKILEAVDPTKLQKFAGKSYGILKAPVVEGVWEEGMQAVTSNGAQAWMDSGFDPSSTKENMTFMEAAYEGFSNTYGTKEGWKEVGVGMIIGFLGGGMATGFKFNEVSQAREANKEKIGYANTFSSENFYETFLNSNKILKAAKDADEAAQRNDNLGKDLATRRLMYTHVQANIRVGREDAAEDFKTAMEGLPQEYWQELGYDSQDQESINGVKENLISEFKDLTKQYKSNKSAAEYLVGKGNIVGVENSSELVEAVAYNLTMGEQADVFASNAFEEIKTQMADELGSKITNSVSVEATLNKAHKNTRERFYSHKRNYEKAQEDFDRAQDELLSVQSLPKEENSDATQRLKDAQKRLNKYQQIMAKESELASQTFAMAQAENPYSGKEASIINVDDLLKTEERLNEAEQYLETLKTTNPIKYESLTKLFDEYNRANYAFKQFNKTVQDLSSNKLKIEEFNDFVRNRLYKGKKANEFTNEFFVTNLESYREAQNAAQADATTQQAASQAERGKSIVSKLSKKQELTETERELYNTNTTFYKKEVRKENLATQIHERGQDFLSGEELEFYTANKEGIDTLVSEKEKGDSIDTSIRPQTQEELNTLKERIENALKNDEVLMNFVGDTYEKLDAKKPTKEEQDRFLELYNQDSLSEEEQSEFQKLRTNLFNWRLVDGTIDPKGYSLADMLLAQQQYEAQPKEDTTKSELSEQESINVAKVEEKDGSKTVDNVNFIQTYENTKVKVSKDGKNYVFSHLNIESILAKFNVDNVKVKPPRKKARTLSETLLEEYRKTPGSVFEINLEDSKIAIEVQKRGRLAISLKDFNRISEEVGMKVVNPNLTKNSYFDVYDKNEDEFTQRDSDFKLEVEEGSQNYVLVFQEIENLKKGDKLGFKVNKKSTFNSKLIFKYKSAKTEEEKSEVLKEIRDTLEIYSTISGNKVAGVTRAIEDKINTNSISQVNHMALRQLAAKRFIESMNSETTEIEILAQVPVSAVLFGSPDLKLKENSGGTLSPDNMDISEEALKQISDFGFKENGKIKTNGNRSSENINTIFLSNLGQTDRVPFIVFEHNNQRIAYPVSLIKTKSPASEQVTQIVNSETLSPSEKILKINDILLESGISPRKYDLMNKSAGQIDSVIKEVVEELEQTEIKPNLDNWLTSDKSILQREARISIDLTNRPLKSPKLMVDFSNIEFDDSLELVENEALEVEVPNKNQVQQIQREDC